LGDESEITKSITCILNFQHPEPLNPSLLLFLLPVKYLIIEAGSRGYLHGLLNVIVLVRVRRKDKRFYKKEVYMKEVVNEILKEEEEARKVIEKTKGEAENIITDAKKQAKTYLEKTETDLKQILAQKQNTTEKQFLAEKDKILKEAEEENIRLRESREKNIPTIAKNLFLQLISKKD